MNVLVDLNVVLDVLLQRQPWSAAAAVVWDANVRGRLRAHLAATSLTNLSYIMRRLHGRDQALRAVQSCLQCFAVLAVDGPLLQQAAAPAGAGFRGQRAVGRRRGRSAGRHRHP